mmetsp:Transcript_51413/g.58257  ORF Transcript_51413/g.58257 Transcript_51413/m.58257 type:complete len:430 (+) Transcript_51413:320-1609(+)
MMMFWTTCTSNYNTVLFLIWLLSAATDESSYNLVFAKAFGYVNVNVDVDVNHRKSGVSSSNSKLCFSTNHSSNNNINWYGSSYRGYHDWTFRSCRRRMVTTNNDKCHSNVRVVSSLSIVPTSNFDMTGTTGTITTTTGDSASADSEVRQQRQRRRKNKTGCRIGGRHYRRYPQQRKSQQVTTKKHNTNPFLFWLYDKKEVYVSTMTLQIPYNFFNKEPTIKGDTFNCKSILTFNKVKDQRNQVWHIMVRFNGAHDVRNYPHHPAVTRVIPSHNGLVDETNKNMKDPFNTNNGALAITVLYDQDEVYRGENDINSKISVWKGIHKQEVYRGENKKQSRIVVRKGSIRFKNNSAEFQDELFPGAGPTGRGGVLAEWPLNHILNACDNEGKLKVEVDIEYEIVPRSIPKVLLDRLQNYKVRYVEYDIGDDNK